MVSDFPFASDMHRAAWLAALLTPLARPAFDGPAPLFLVDANVRAAGKGLSLEVISRIVTGNPFPVISYPVNPNDGEEELRKKITSFLLYGDRIAALRQSDQGVRRRHPRPGANRHGSGAGSHPRGQPAVPRAADGHLLRHQQQRRHSR